MDKIVIVYNTVKKTVKIYRSLYFDKVLMTFNNCGIKSVDSNVGYIHVVKLDEPVITVFSTTAGNAHLIIGEKDHG